jgi:hypothetical protein
MAADPLRRSPQLNFMNKVSPIHPLLKVFSEGERQGKLIFNISMAHKTYNSVFGKKLSSRPRYKNPLSCSKLRG